MGDRVGVTVGVTDLLGEGDGDGQFCASAVESSPIGPSSMEPILALNAMQATSTSQPSPREDGIRVYGCTLISK